ncbi:hypothetical protein Bbelb_382870 [Branchiostoma belcheri]|nr:hypothetical protein Bbelb_382870 [Branchiostoma belcheri]
MTTPVTSVVSTTAAVSQTTASLVDMSKYVASTSVAALSPLGEQQQHGGFLGATLVPPRTEPGGQGSQPFGQNFVIDDAALFQHINSMVSQAVAQSLQAQGFAREQISQPIVSEQDSFSTSEDSDHGRRSRSKHRFIRTYADRFRERSRSPFKAIRRKKAIPAASQAAGRGRKANQQPTASLSASPGASSRLESHNDDSLSIHPASGSESLDENDNVSLPAETSLLCPNPTLDQPAFLQDFRSCEAGVRISQPVFNWFKRQRCQTWRDKEFMEAEKPHKLDAEQLEVVAAPRLQPSLRDKWKTVKHNGKLKVQVQAVKLDDTICGIQEHVLKAAQPMLKSLDDLQQLTVSEDSETREKALSIATNLNVTGQLLGMVCNQVTSFRRRLIHEWVDSRYKCLVDDKAQSEDDRLTIPSCKWLLGQDIIQKIEEIEKADKTVNKLNVTGSATNTKGYRYQQSSGNAGGRYKKGPGPYKGKWQSITTDPWHKDYSGSKAPSEGATAAAFPSERTCSFTGGVSDNFSGAPIPTGERSCDSDSLGRGRVSITSVLVPKKTGAWRPVVNLRPLNQYVDAPHFKMEGLQDLKSLLIESDYMASIDIRDAYFHIPVHESFRRLALPLEGSDLGVFRGQGWDSLLHLTQGTLSELTTWVECLESWNGKSFLPPPRQTCLTITSDASLAGWGDTCGHLKAGGRWTDEESKLHIIELELKAAFFAVEIWKWALARKLHLSVEHLPGVFNTVADAESRSFNDHTE